MAEVFSREHILLCQEQLEVRDRRIAELEAALADTHRYLGWDFDPDVILGSPHEAQMRKVYETLHGGKWNMSSPLNAALAAAKREALEAAAKWFYPSLTNRLVDVSSVARELRRMAQGVKP